ncbi:MAG: hypothetical protein ABN480_06945 [Dickeya sp.]
MAGDAFCGKRIEGRAENEGRAGRGVNIRPPILFSHHRFSSVITDFSLAARSGSRPIPLQIQRAASTSDDTIHDGAGLPNFWRFAVTEAKLKSCTGKTIKPWTVLVDHYRFHHQNSSICDSLKKKIRAQKVHKNRLSIFSMSVQEQNRYTPLFLISLSI